MHSSLPKTDTCKPQWPGEVELDGGVNQCHAQPLALCSVKYEDRKRLFCLRSFKMIRRINRESICTSAADSPGTFCVTVSKLQPGPDAFAAFNELEQITNCLGTVCAFVLVKKRKRAEYRGDDRRRFMEKRGNEGKQHARFSSSTILPKSFLLDQPCSQDSAALLSPE